MEEAKKMIIKRLSERYEDVSVCDLNDLLEQGIQRYNLKPRAAGNIIRSVLGAVYEQQEVFAKLEVSEMVTTAAKGFYRIVIDRLKKDSAGIYIVL